MNLELRDKVAVVTGGSRGMGLAIAEALASEGCDVAICGREPGPLDTAVARLRKAGGRVFGHAADVTLPGEVEGFIEATASQLGGVDCLVCSAGGLGANSLLDSTNEEWRAALEVNVIHAVRAVRAAVPFFVRRGGGSIVLISSISGWRPERISPGYCVSKAAEIYLAPSLLWDLAPRNVRINAVSPGSILHENSGWADLRGRDPETYAAYENHQFPSHRLGTAEEVANVVAFLVSPRASWINGANVPVDGGQVGGLAGARL